MREVDKLTVSRLRKVLSYDPETGEFRWKRKMSSRAMPGSIAGTKTVFGYIQIRIDGVIHRAHRLAWLIETGEHPRGEIDHVNRVRDDNRFRNLRDVQTQTNRENIGLNSRRNASTGLLGVTIHKKSGLFVAQIHTEGRHISLGYFREPEAAHEAYLEAKRRLHAGNTL